MYNELALTLGIMLPLLVFVVLITAFMPYYSRKTISFGIAVPENTYHDPYLAKLRRRYLTICLVVGAAITLVSSLCYLWFNAESLLWVQIIALFVYLGISFVIYFSNYRLVMKYKQQSDWKIETKTTAVLKEEQPVKKPLHAAWYFVYVAVIAATAIATAIIYPSLPSQFPMHYNMAGMVDRYADKSFLSAALMPIVMVLTGLIFFGIHFAVTRAKRQGDFQKDSAFRSAMSKALFLIGLCTMLLLAAVQFSVLTVLPEQFMVILPIVFIVLIFVILIVIIASVGQGGSRIKNGTKKADDTAGDDSHWVMGVIYKNKEDPSVFVENRMGMGYTINIANPVSIIILVGIVVAVIAIVAVTVAVS